MKIQYSYFKLIFIIILASLFIGCSFPGFDSDFSVDRRAFSGGRGTSDDGHGNDGNDNPGVPKGTEYGDLYAILRSDEGVPVMTEILGNWYVQPVDALGNLLTLNEEGEVIEEDLPYALEVDMGRLNLVRSPHNVLDAAFEEVMNLLNNSEEITLDFCGRLTAWNDGEIVKTIDSPRENMALYRYLMNYMYEDTEENNFNNRLKFLGDSPNNIDPLMLAASCFAAGSDKSGRVYIDELVYVNGFLDCVGLNPLVSENELDWKDQNKEYFNFGDYDGAGHSYNYDREKVYHERYIQFQIWEETFYPIDENGDCRGPIFPIDTYMESLNLFSETYVPAQPDGVSRDTKVFGFTRAIDDAVQVLELIHGDPYIRYLYDYSPADDEWPDWPE